MSEIETIAKACLAVGALVGAGWAVWRRIQARLRADREARALESKAIRYNLDATRQALHALVVLTGAGREEQVFELDQLVRHRALIGSVSDELFVLDGHEPERNRRRTLEHLDEVMRVLTRTQAIQARSRPVQMLPGRQDMFRDGDLE